MILRFRHTRFALVAILLFLASPLDAQGQQAEKVYRIGYLSFAPLRPRARAPRRLPKSFA